jgi:hypothetical protein
MYSSYSNKPASVRQHSAPGPNNPEQHTIEFRVVTVEGQLRLEEKHVFANQRSVSYPASSISTSNSPLALGPNAQSQHADYHTSDPVTSNTAHQAIDPIGMLLRLAHHDGVAFLENLVDRDEGLERLDLVGENRLPTMRKHRSVPDIPVCPFSISRVSHTLSCLPKRPPTTCGPTCTRYSCAHVSLQESVSVESTAEISMARIGVPRKEQWVRYADVRLGAVSSVASQMVSPRSSPFQGRHRRTSTYRCWWPCGY